MNGEPQEAIETLLAYDFPENVRELERALAMGARDEVGLDALPDLRPRRPTAAGGPLEKAEHEVIRKVLKRHGGDKDAAARELGISRRTLFRRIRDLSVDSGR